HYPHPHHYHQGQVPPAHIPPGYVPPQMAHAYVGGVHPGMAPPPQPTPQPEPESDPMFEQAQAMLEGALGEEAGMFKEILGTIGMNDKEFWKGAMVGAAAALVLSNENVRKGLMGALSGAGNMLKSGGETVKDTATQTASTVQQNVTAGSEIFRDTYAAGKEGFKESVERHQQERTTQAESPEQIESLPPSDTEK
ncbi:YtxH domain-containing protein, partial [Photobacterium sanctipauli]